MSDPWAEVAETIDEFRTEDMDTADIVRWLRERFDITPLGHEHNYRGIFQDKVLVCACGARYDRLAGEPVPSEDSSRGEPVPDTPPGP